METYEQVFHAEGTVCRSKDQEMVVGGEQLEDPGDFGKGAYRIDYWSGRKHCKNANVNLMDMTMQSQAAIVVARSRGRIRERLRIEARTGLECREFPLTSDAIMVGRHRSTTLWLTDRHAGYCLPLPLPQRCLRKYGQDHWVDDQQERQEDLSRSSQRLSWRGSSADEGLRSCLSCVYALHTSASR